MALPCELELELELDGKGQCLLLIGSSGSQAGIALKITKQQQQNAAATKRNATQCNAMQRNATLRP